MEFSLSELYLQRKKGVVKTYVVSCAMYYVICRFSIFFYFAALGCDIPDRSAAILQLGRKTTFKLYQLTPEEFCWNSLSRTIESSLCGSIGPWCSTLREKPGSLHDFTVCNRDPAHMLSATLPNIILQLCIAYRSGQIDVVSAQMAIDAPKRTIPLDVCLKDH